MSNSKSNDFNYISLGDFLGCSGESFINSPRGTVLLHNHLGVCPQRLEFISRKQWSRYKTGPILTRAGSNSNVPNFCVKTLCCILRLVLETDTRKHNFQFEWILSRFCPLLHWDQGSIIVLSQDLLYYSWYFWKWVKKNPNKTNHKQPELAILKILALLLFRFVSKNAGKKGEFFSKFCFGVLFL